MLKLNYQNVCVGKLHQELIDSSINPNAVMTLQDFSCELQFHKIFEYELKDEEGNVTGYEYKEKLTVTIDEGLETERTEEQLIPFDYDSLVANIQAVVDCHDNTDYESIKKPIYDELTELDKDLQRGTEDIIELFITKGLITEQELQPKTIERLNRKKELRASLKEV